MKNKLLAGLALTVVGVSSSPCFAITPWGERDETDTLRSARTYHIMFTSVQEAQEMHRRLVNLQGAELFEQFQRAARAESKDPGSAPQGGDLGVIQQSEMVKSFDQGLFSLSPRTLSAPIKSEFGWHLIYATDFKEEQVADICTASLNKALKQASAQDKAGLSVATESVSSATFAKRIADFLGPQWGPPMKDVDGNLTFIQAVSSKTKPDQAIALIHTEYSRAVLSTNVRACRRSVRQEFMIDCSARTTVSVRRSEFEGRAAVGRNLLEMPRAATAQPEVASSNSLGAQLVAVACRGK